MTASVPPFEVGLVLSGHVSSCPRAVKFADALSAHGIAVRVFAIQHTAWVSELDRALLASRPWPVTLVDHSHGFLRVLRAGEQRLALATWRAGLRGEGIARWGEARWVRSLVAAAGPFRPRAWIGFNIPGMLAVDQLARSGGAHCVVDVEDDHVGIHPDTETVQRSRLEQLLKPLLRRAVHRITTSTEMGEVLTRRYGVDFQILHNVPVLDGAPSVPLDQRRRSLYWCSQTVGPDRGLEEFLPIFARLPGDLRLALLGRVADDYRRSFLATAAALGIAAERIDFLPSVPPGQMLASARPHLLGLALENGYTENHRVCLANKIFDYFGAGLPVVFSPTTAQSRLATELGDAACLIDVAAPDASAARIRALLADPGRLARAVERSLAAAERRYCWQVEQEHLVDAMRPFLDR